MKEFFRSLFINFIRVFSFPNLPFHIFAILLTFLIVTSGFDWNFFLFAASAKWSNYFFPALMLGSLLPILLPLILLISGFILKNKKTLTIGLAQTQAAILGSFVSSIYKSFTGRIQPPAHFHETVINLSTLVDNSHAFQFGFWRHGIFWGWPSSHTTIAFSMAVAVFVLFPKNKIIRFLAIFYAFFVGVGVAVTSIHWLSEFVAGAIIGTLIGVVIGKSYKK
jgi:membrane-associated phospholipid phosphatase